MTLGYDKPLYLLAFDHRGSFEEGLFGTKEPVSAQVKAGIVDTKELIFDAHLEVVKDGRVPASASGVLVDEEFGSSVARKAKAEGAPLAMPVERSGQDDFSSSMARIMPSTSRPSTRPSPRCSFATTLKVTSS